SAAQCELGAWRIPQGLVLGEATTLDGGVAIRVDGDLNLIDGSSFVVSNATAIHVVGNANIGENIDVIIAGGASLQVAGSVALASTASLTISANGGSSTAPIVISRCISLDGTLLVNASELTSPG